MVRATHISTPRLRFRFGPRALGSNRANFHRRASSWNVHHGWNFMKFVRDGPRGVLEILGWYPRFVGNRRNRGKGGGYFEDFWRRNVEEERWVKGRKVWKFLSHRQRYWISIESANCAVRPWLKQGNTNEKSRLNGGKYSPGRWACVFACSLTFHCIFDFVIGRKSASTRIEQLQPREFLFNHEAMKYYSSFELPNILSRIHLSNLTRIQNCSPRRTIATHRASLQTIKTTRNKTVPFVEKFL